MGTKVEHKPFCFGGEPAPCEGYFPDDVLPCVCTIENVLVALSEQAFPCVPGGIAHAKDQNVAPEEQKVAGAAGGSNCRTECAESDATYFSPRW